MANLGIDTIKQTVLDAFEIGLGIEELLKKGRKPTLLKRMLAGARAIDLGYEIAENFPKVKAEIAELSEVETKELIDFVKAQFKSEAQDNEVKYAIAIALDNGVAFFKSCQTVARLLKVKDETVVEVPTAKS